MFSFFTVKPRGRIKIRKFLGLFLHRKLITSKRLLLHQREMYYSLLNQMLQKYFLLTYFSLPLNGGNVLPYSSLSLLQFAFFMCCCPFLIFLIHLFFFSPIIFIIRSCIFSTSAFFCFFRTLNL
jgi:hypothetical protein